MKNTLNQIDLEKDKKLGNETMKNITTTLDKIVGCLDDNFKKELKNNTDRIKELLNLIKQETQKRSDEIGYDYDDINYEKKLCISNDFFCKVLKEKILNKDGIKTNLGKYFEEYMKLLNDDEIIKNRLIKELFEDLVYESFDIEEVDNGKIIVKKMNFGQNNLGERLGKNGIIPLVEDAGKTGSKSLNLMGNKLGKYLQEKGMIELVQIAGNNGIKILNLGSNDLGEYLQEKGMIKLIQEIGNVGIKNLNLWNSDLGKHLGKDGLIKIITISGGYGIKNLNLNDNGLGKYLQEVGVLELIRIAGQNGVKILDLRFNGLDKTKKNLIEEGQKYKINVII